MLVGIGLVGLVLFGAQKYLFNRNAEQASTEAPTTQGPGARGADSSGSKPSPVGHPQVPDDSAKQEPAPQTPPEATAPESHATPPPPAPPNTPPQNTPPPSTAPAHQESEPPARPRTQPERSSTPVIPPKSEVGQSVQFLTDPPGAQVTVDGNSSLACKTPCMLPLSGGRHALTVQLAGYRPYPRVFSVPQDGDLFLRLSKTAGTLSVTSEPAGATIELDGAMQSKRTPSVFSLAPGKYHIKVSRNGAFIDFDVELRDGEFLNKRVDF
jgi:hypothetical protein